MSGGKVVVRNAVNARGVVWGVHLTVWQIADGADATGQSETIITKCAKILVVDVIQAVWKVLSQTGAVHGQIVSRLTSGAIQTSVCSTEWNWIRHGANGVGNVVTRCTLQADIRVVLIGDTVLNRLWEARSKICVKARAAHVTNVVIDNIGQAVRQVLRQTAGRVGQVVADGTTLALVDVRCISCAVWNVLLSANAWDSWNEVITHNADGAVVIISKSLTIVV